LCLVSNEVQCQDHPVRTVYLATPPPQYDST